MSSVYERLRALEVLMATSAASEVRETPLGTAVLTPELPAAHDVNALMARPGAAAAHELADHLDELYAGLGHRKAWMYDDAAGAQIADGMRARGFDAERFVVLALRGAPPAAEAVADEVSREAIAELERAEMLQDGLAPDVADQLMRMRDRTAARLAARYFLAAGSAHARLYRHGGLASITDVGTLEAARGRGLARAVIATATQAALSEGVRDVVLVTDADDWMQGFYRRLGFTDEAGAGWTFTATGR